MESSRIFVRNLPPTINEADFRKHFSAKGKITDVKVIPQRRIGYVGYKTPQDAVDAVKYFNRSYIRLSKIAVEIAKPISDPSLRTSRKVKTGQAIVSATMKQASEAAAPAEEEAKTNVKNKKRKREDLDLADPKLQEFMDTMNPGERGVTKQEFAAGQAVGEPVPDQKMMAGLDAESDDEYEEVPARPAKRLAVEETPAPRVEQRQPESSPHVEADDRPAPKAYDTVGATDDDWLRSRTSRLLDLVDPDDPNALASTQQADTHPTAPTAPTVVDSEETESTQENDRPPQIESDQPDDPVAQIRKTCRLFVRNLPYSATEEDIRAHFAVFGNLEEVHLSVGSSSASKGFAFVLYTSPASAVDAFQKSDGCPFQGRILHVLPGSAKRVPTIDPATGRINEFAISKLPLKTQNMIRKKAKAASSRFNWNALFMSQDAVNSSAADRLGVSKAELLDPTSADAAVRQALAETSIIQETKAYFVANGVDLDAFRQLSMKQRGDTTILVKNFPYGTTVDELRKMFEEHGAVLRVLMPPSGTIAIVQFAQAPHARAAFASLAYRRFKNSMLLLEKGPKDLFRDQGLQPQPQPSTQVQLKDSPAAAAKKPTVADLLERDNAQDIPERTSLFVRDLNFATTTAQLAEAFEHLDGFLSARVKTKTDPKKPGQVLSMGFGFVEFRTKAQAQTAIKAMDGVTLDGHTLAVKASHRGMDAAEERRREDKAKKAAAGQRKIVIKNLPFEATKKDVRALFSSYGQLSSVRVPKSSGNKTRGFAFAEFTTPKEAENALQALRNTHLLGRRLVLEFAEADTTDPEEEIAKMQSKMEGQARRVAAQGFLSKRARRDKVAIGEDGEGGEGGGGEA